MIEIQKLKNEALLQKTKALALEERKLTLEILHHLQEISRRRLFAFCGFSSLFEYVTKELGYSSAAAMRRISAMRLLNEVPEIEEKIESGALSLSVAAQAQKLFQLEAKLNRPLALNDKKSILVSLENKSSREAERELIRHSSQSISLQLPDQIKVVTPTQSEVRFVADQTLIDQLEQVKGLLAHKNPHLSLGELIAEMAKISLEKLQPKSPKNNSHSDVELKVNHSTDGSSSVGEPQAKLKQNPRRTLPVEVKRIVYHRDQGKCQYVDPVSGRKCLSSHAIQYDHFNIPFAQGGPNTVENLRLLCATHNRIMAIETYGQKMAKYIQLA